MAKLISIDEVKQTLAQTNESTFYIPEGRVLAPAARDYLNSLLIRIDTQKHKADNDRLAYRRNDAPATYEEKRSNPLTDVARAETAVKTHTGESEMYDYRTGLRYSEKPEYMTHIRGKDLVMKTEPVIRYRGKLDQTQAMIVLAQSMMAQCGCCQSLISDLDDVLCCMRDLMRCEVNQEAVPVRAIIGMSHEELREQSHDPETFFGVAKMTVPDYRMGPEYAWLNYIRTCIRETEIAAVEAFREGPRITRTDIIEELNRLSSAVHILMCRCLSGRYS